MTALHDTFKVHRDQHRFWSYQEVLIEAAVVIWISSGVSSELFPRFFPQWRSIRTHPAAKRCGDYFWMLLGFGSDLNVWDRALIPWTTSSDTVQDSHTTPTPDPAGCTTNIVIGTIGTYATLITTTILFLAFFYSLLVNRHWRRPAINSPWPLYHTVNEISIQGIEREECALLDKSGVRRDLVTVAARYQKCHYNRASCLRRCIAILPDSLVVWATVLPTPIVLAVSIVAWVTLSVLPVVILAIIAARKSVAWFGDDGLFPSYVLLACILTIYSTGRITGMWMRKTYPEWIWIIIKSICFGSHSTEADPKDTRFETVIAPCHPTWGTGKLYLCCMFLCVSITGVLDGFPRAFAPLNWALGSTALNQNSTLNCTNTIKLGYQSAVVSYWVDLSGYLPFSTNPDILSTVSPVAGAICYTWLYVLWYATFLPMFLPFVGLLLQILALRRLEKLHTRSSPMLKRYPKWYTYVYDQPPEQGLPRCICSEVRTEIPFAIEMGRSAFTMVALPYCFLQFFFPERYHLPGYVLIHSGCFIWICVTFGCFVRDHWWRYTQHSYDQFGGKLSRGHELFLRERRRKFDAEQKRPAVEQTGETPLRIRYFELP